MSAGQIPTRQVTGLGSAATYNVPASGDAAVGEVVLGSDSRLGSGGGGSGALTRIAEYELAAAASTITFASIPGTYSNLRLILTARSNASAVIDNVRVFANADSTATHYKYKLFYGTTTTAYTSASDTFVGFIPGDTATANEAGSLEVIFPHYAKTTFRKVFQSQYYSPGTPVSGLANTVWLNTAAITNLQLLLATGQFMTGTIATLYGLA